MRFSQNYKLLTKAALLLVLTLGTLTPVVAQKNPYMFDKTTKRDKKVREPWLPPTMRYARAGWFVSPGVTYSLDRFRDPVESLSDPDNNTRLDYTFRPRGRFGPYLEGGRYRIFNRGFFKYIDYGLAIKKLTGREIMEATLIDLGDNSTVATYTSDGKFRETSGSAFFNANHILTTTNWTFVQNSIGLNLDYRFLQRNEFEGFIPVAENYTNGPNALAFQLHYKLGFGFRTTKQLMIIPTIETPILNIVKFDQFKSTTQWFSSRYRPLIITLRFLFLRDSNKTECPPVYTNPDDFNKESGGVWGGRNR